MRATTWRLALGRNRRGAALVEMAAILPVFVLIVFGILEAARMCMVSQLLTNAAREGCRVAVCKDRTLAEVTTLVKAILSGSGITASTVTVTSDPANLQTAGMRAPITLTVQVPFKDVNWLPAPFVYSSTTVRARATLRSERP